MTKSPADRVIEVFGGIRPTARAVGRAPSTVQGWKESGLVPSQEQARILKIARRRKLGLTAEDLIGVPSRRSG